MDVTSSRFGFTVVSLVEMSMFSVTGDCDVEAASSAAAAAAGMAAVVMIAAAAAGGSSV